MVQFWGVISLCLCAVSGLELELLNEAALSTLRTGGITLVTQRAQRWKNVEISVRD